jgi:hypothetical protein
MKKMRLLTAAGMAAFAALIFSVGCTKGTTPIPPPVHDTVVVYGSRPDTTVNLTKGLLLYLPFSGDIADSSGNNNPTQAVGTVLGYDAHGYANNAFNATGAGERIYVTNNGSIKFDTAWAISLGFMVNVNKSQTYISMVDPVTGTGPSFNFGNTLAAYPQYLASGSGDITTDCGTFGIVNNYNITDSTTFSPVPGSWYNAVVQYHRGTIKTYINGTLISTKVGQGTLALNCPNSKVVIGEWWNGNPPDNSMSMNGKLDNIRLYNRVLTPGEISYLSQHYQVTSNSVKPGVETN